MARTAAAAPARLSAAAAAALTVLALLPAAARAQYPNYIGYYGPINGNNRATIDRCSQGVMAGSRAYRDMLTQGRCPTPCVAVQWVTPVNDALSCVSGYEVEVRGFRVVVSRSGLFACLSRSLACFQKHSQTPPHHDQNDQKNNTSSPRPTARWSSARRGSPTRAWS